MLKNIRWTESRAVATSAGRVRSPTTTSAPSAPARERISTSSRYSIRWIPYNSASGRHKKCGRSPLGLRNVFVLPTPTGLHHTDSVALLRGAERGNASPESRTDDHQVRSRSVPMSSLLTDRALPPQRGLRGSGCAPSLRHAVPSLDRLDAACEGL